MDRDELYERINNRVDLMMKQSLLEEVKQLVPYKAKAALQTVGYQELFEYLEGNISLERAIELIKQNSRRYAKRQLTWLRRDKGYKWFKPDEEAEIMTYIQSKTSIN